MIRGVELWSGQDNHSHFEEGVLDLEPGRRDATARRTADSRCSLSSQARCKLARSFQASFRQRHK
jgi:hypothetical protein